MTSKPASLADVTARILDSYRTDDRAGSWKQPTPSRAAVAEILVDIEQLCFPGYLPDRALTDETLVAVTTSLVSALHQKLTAQLAFASAAQATSQPDSASIFAAGELAQEFLAAIPELRAALSLDVTALLEGDPAARGKEEIILAYPGARAITGHRVAHWFWSQGARLLARMMSEDVHGRTGIDIHPGAVIGRSFYIDHGTGVVIGETTVIGDHVKIYQGVSLGALSVSRRLQDQKRHPTIEDFVTIYAGATILGGDTVVGHHSVVGGNVWLVHSVPPHSIVEHESVVKVGQKTDRKPT